MDDTWIGVIIILITILGATGTAYRWIHQDISGLRGEVSNVKERMAKIEGAFDGFMNRERS